MTPLHKALDQYLEGAITFVELVHLLTMHYLEAQAKMESTCATCGSDLSRRLG